MENLRAMGAKPETIPGAAGETIIKINAPILNNERIANNENNEKPKNQKV